MPQRWNKFIREYHQPEAFDKFMDLAKKGGRTEEVSYQPENLFGHKLGPCFTHLSVRRGLEPAVTLVSRSSFLAPLGLLDLNYALLVAHEVASSSRNFNVEDMTINWYIPTLQVSTWMIQPFIQSSGWEVESGLDTHFAKEVRLAAKRILDPEWLTQPYLFYRFWNSCLERVHREMEKEPFYGIIPGSSISAND